MADGQSDEPGLGTRLAIGAIAGFVATMAMTAAMRRLHNKLPARGSESQVPAAPDDFALLTHFAYGAGCGALLAALNPKPGKLGGALAGGGIWLASYMGWIPAFGLPRPAAGQPRRRSLVMLGAHFAWGWSTAEGMRELGKARATIFAEGPAPDAPYRR